MTSSRESGRSAVNRALRSHPPRCAWSHQACLRRAARCCSPRTVDMTSDRVIPNTVDRDTRGFFDAACQGQLVVCVCGRCRRVLHPPRGICDGCGGTEIVWDQVSGAATLYSWTVIEHQVHRSFDVPYTVVVVELVDRPGVRFVG